MGSTLKIPPARRRGERAGPLSPAPDTRRGGPARPGRSARGGRSALGTEGPSPPLTRPQPGPSPSRPLTAHGRPGPAAPRPPPTRKRRAGRKRRRLRSSLSPGPAPPSVPAPLLPQPLSSLLPAALPLSRGGADEAAGYERFPQFIDSTVLRRGRDTGGEGPPSPGPGTANGSDTAQPRAPGGSGPGAAGTKADGNLLQSLWKGGEAAARTRGGARPVTRPDRGRWLGQRETAGPGCGSCSSPQGPAATQTRCFPPQTPRTTAESLLASRCFGDYTSLAKKSICSKKSLFIYLYIFQGKYLFLPKYDIQAHSCKITLNQFTIKLLLVINNLILREAKRCTSAAVLPEARSLCIPRTLPDAPTCAPLVLLTGSCPGQKQLVLFSLHEAESCSLQTTSTEKQR
ncbi:uncharacterized protein LOC113969782 [Neopelma chrysocephalum]|uniref:uncharacterized protein LOC113969782 n=1 Tax=Neopelma chrysocephalum TaxID=114329 RepID=UPI000FCCF9ED|nr:uncharacterized protein LOC113969782 [Neopelma chrysocephalum]